MIKKSFIAILTFLLLVTSTLSAIQDQVVNANPMNLKPFYEIITVQSPQNNSHCTNPVSLNFTVIRNAHPLAGSFYYTINGSSPQKINYTSQLEIVSQREIKDDFNPSPPYDLDPYTFHTLNILLKCNLVLSQLDEGWYNLTVYRHNSASVCFYINTPLKSSAPTLTIPEFPTVLATTFLIVTTLAVAVLVRRKHQVSNSNNSNAES